MSARRGKQRESRVARPESAQGASPEMGYEPPLRSERLFLPEWQILAVILVIGVGLRLFDLSRSAVEHFDEAIYASNLLFPGGEWPGRQFYAPPLLPAAIEWFDIAGLMVFGSLPVWWPLLPAWLCGVATIPSLWWIGRRWFSPAAGLTAAGIVAISGLHSAYSASALTDVPLTLALLWGNYWFCRALTCGSDRDAVIAGLMTAIAWWTKYNGWLVLAVGISGGLAAQLVVEPAQRRFKVWLRASMIATGVAAVAWFPVWWWDAARVGGYAKIAANHRGYLHGLDQWLTAAVQQISAIASYDAPWFRMGLLAALVVTYVFFMKNMDGYPITIRGLFTWWAAGGGFFAAMSVPCGLTLVPGLWSDGRRRRPGENSPLSTVDLTAWCLVFAAVLGLTLSIPFYRAYPRLAVPWLIVTSLLWGGILSRWISRVSQSSSQGGVAFLVTLITAGAVGLALRPDKLSAWPGENRFAAVQSAARIARTLRDRNAGQDPLTFLTGDPALYHHLLRRHNLATVLVGDLSFVEQPPPGPVFFIMGYMAERDEPLQTAWKKVADRFELVDEFDVHPSRIVLFDFHAPATFAAHPERKTMTQRVYRLKV